MHWPVKPFIIAQQRVISNISLTFVVVYRSESSTQQVYGQAAYYKGQQEGYDLILI